MTGSSREFYGTGTNFFRYRYRYFFPGPIFFGTGTGTFFRDQIFSVPVPVLFPGPNFSGTGTGTFSGTNFFRYRYFFPGPIFSGTETGTFFRDQIFLVPVPVLFSKTKFFRYQYRYHPKRSNIPGTGMSHSGREGKRKSASLSKVAFLMDDCSSIPCSTLEIASY